MEDFKEKKQIDIGSNQTKLNSDIVITKSGSIYRDLRLFIEALDKKFEFINRDVFLEDFIEFIHFDLSDKSAKELDLIEDKFFELIQKNSSKPDLKDNFKKAGNELEKFVNGIKVWRKK